MLCHFQKLGGPIIGALWQKVLYDVAAHNIFNPTINPAKPHFNAQYAGIPRDLWNLPECQWSFLGHSRKSAIPIAVNAERFNTLIISSHYTNGCWAFRY